MSGDKKSGMLKYCVVGNIAKKHVDENGVTRYGTAAFPGGRKVYISRRLWGDETVTVMGLNRFLNKYTRECVPLALIENIRFSKTFKKRVLELMAYDTEYHDMWWSYKEEDRNGAEEYARILQRVKDGDKEALAQYTREVMVQFCSGLVNSE